MTPDAFAILCFISFAVPIPLLVWLDRPRKKAGQG
jgi:hypothetical protein